jgi:hypothetical protein
MATTTTVLALFKDKRDAEAAVRALKSARFDSARLGIVPPGRAHVPRFGMNAVTGIAAGIIACGIAGLLLGLVLAWWLHGGWLVPVMFTVTGAATGALAGMLISQSVSSQDALYYEEEVEAGRTLVTVMSDAERAEDARRILLQEGAFEAAPIDAPIKKAS